MATEAQTPYIVVVGVDYSETAELALDAAFEAATGHDNAEVHVVSVVNLYGPVAQVDVNGKTENMSLEEANNKLTAHVDAKLKAFKQRRKGKLFDRVVSHIRVEFPAEQVAQLASDLEADLIVVGTHGRRGLRRLVLGSVAEGVVRHATCPVLVVRPKGIAESVPVPKIEPPCPRCIETRKKTGGKELWCEQHREKHGRRHTYHYGDHRMAQDSNFPLVEPE